MSRARVTAAVVAVLGLATQIPAATDPAERARAILSDGGYQTDLPRGASTAPEAHPGRRAAAPEVGFPTAIPVPRGVLPLTALVTVVATGLWLLLRRLDPTLGLGPVSSGAPAASAFPQLAPTDDPEALARAGRFSEAIHALLLGALREVSPNAQPPLAWTSREVLRSAALRPEARTALTPLVGAVEAVHFGGAPAGPDDYAASAAMYRRFREACRPSP